MTSRRSFVKNSMTALAAYGLSRTALAATGMHDMTYGVQLFMLREQATNDLPGALNAIHSAGFAQVELYPIAYNRPAAELKQMVKDAGLGAVSGHFDYVGLEAKLDYAHDLGLRYMVCPMLPADQWTSLAGFRKAADLFNRVGKGAQERGMEFVFHNHDYEFRPMEGSDGFHQLMSATDPNLVKLELDMYWLTQAGQDPLAMLKRYASRVRLVHLKDRTAGAATSFDMDAHSEHFTELGRGTINWPAILSEATKQGIHYAFLDQDKTAGSIFASMKASREYLRSIS